MLNVNTISFNGTKAVINSYSDHPALVQYMVEQRDWFAARYPMAIVQTERMHDAECMALVRLERDGITCHNVGRLSEGLEPLKVAYSRY